ncbi:tRNA (N(6)-L-threonylcarbamoyladenosine(37)-C(2))-methylthiotransferase MtaB [Halocella sp. SP3-1]|uniref:tRNA (N(6)-L-threonylcarbamoyladenosine(37)-C(2))- methylthiotransferase MtaB n=1 Tax=Halocella sp. SP3-1 TaxID=2382161 RepID=UPI000F74CB74|nr:tRNA (N(6)-L-threonylcarbamoyladenosine(37)-C(2))-methylthiotransferase MtaB [Halocella sp. SP3-1]AZO95004.1 tRNA (N(6)-L-threonylcarbamoyladenosine(37)-C(2))-methylthiotransferase MtaB [Halocella sp. SP3-1]MTI61277.1 tRNA (N(6)-L-threonylcarbamoyladenosine(37)-C(2))-methylthiotransferase MtaB [Bacillota bacterium]
MATVAFHTLGCKVNHYESEAMMDLFKDKGYQLVDFNDRADIYVVNTCTVTNEAARKSRQLARRAKRNNPVATVVMVGCYTQVSPDEVSNIEEIDLVIGTSKRTDIVRMVEEVRSNCNFTAEIVDWQELKEFEELRVNTLTETTRAYVKVEEGCNQFCTYCIIPYARGPVRSREIDSVLEEVEELVNGGVKEIILTGTHLGAYGYDWGENDSLVKLLKHLSAVDDLAHIRLSSIEVTEINDNLLALIAREDKLCSHLHLPLQSGSDYILKAMKRPYSKREFNVVVDKVRNIIEDIAITTDLIVGFPGEEEKYFKESYDFVKEIAFSRLHVFPFSARRGTPAAKMKGQLAGDIKKYYSKMMRQLNKELMQQYQQGFIGDIRSLIIEEKRDYQTGKLTGMTDNYLRVLCDGDNEMMGKLVDVKLINSFNHENLIGKIVI